MNGWQQLVALAAAVFAILSIVLLILWLRARRALARLDDRRSESAWARIDRELALAEQAGRFRIIRELQDVAILSVSRIVAQTDAVRYTAPSDPAVALRSTAVLGTQARDALGDMRRVLTVIREGETVSMPQPGLQSARELFRVMRDAGLEVSFSESGDAFDLKQGAELAIFRILQGTLENSLKHGGAGTDVKVGFVWRSDGLQVTVDDDGIRSAARRAGLRPDQIDETTQYTIEEDLRALTERITGAGLTEMRERAELFGGVLTAKTVPGIGFSVSAVFPSLRFHNGVHGVNLARTP